MLSPSVAASAGPGRQAVVQRCLPYLRPLPVSGGELEQPGEAALLHPHGLHPGGERALQPRLINLILCLALQISAQNVSAKFQRCTD